MSRAQQSSIRSFFTPRRLPEYAAPPSASTAPPTNTNVDAQLTSSSPPAPPAPPPPPSAQASSAPNPTGPSSAPISITLPPNGVPVLPVPPSLPSGATVVPLAEHHIPALRRINSLLLPVAYPDSFYAKALDPAVSGLFSRAILWQDSAADTPKVIGGLICRIEPNPYLDSQGQALAHPAALLHPQKSPVVPADTPYHAIYIQSLTLLSPYRSLGLAAAALEHIIATAVLLPAAGSNVDARTVYAHVWTENEEGLRWYESRGFTREGAEPVKGYYFKLRPDTAWVVRRHIGPAANINGTHAPESVSNTTAATPPTGPVSQPLLAAAAAAAPSSTGKLAPPPRRSPTTLSPSPAGSASSLSFQNARPQTEWNDLPADMVSTATAPRNSNTSLIGTAGLGGNGPPAASGSNASSRSSSTTGRKKRERTYPSAAFGP
ncbi:uncharacterized protein C8A04DRAFT_10959 [Dichotomopilus funicola]|uniref:N-acetyltransferase domain-containing protein n=1 Tax=Dichotomopilus funicola TaxID=1934379 RepID=A0AAN6V539_9PEZI|nr:hypothetical protein C8A04DRAFT_10959 [Dichotomopilus funicola]